MLHKNSKQRKISQKPIGEKLIPLLVIFVMIFYPLAFPLWIIRAQEETTAIAEETTTEKVEAKPAEAEEKPTEVTIQENVKVVETEATTQKPAESPVIAETEKKEVIPAKEEPIETANENAPIENDIPKIDVDVIETVSSETKTEPVIENIENQNLPDPDATSEENSADLNTTELPKEETPDENKAKTCCETGGECCPKTTIENNNDANIANTNDSLAETGNNTIGDPQVAEEVASNNETNDNNKDNENDESTEASQEPNLETKTEPNLQPTEGEVATEVAVSDTAIVNEANTNILSENYIDSVTNITGDENYDINLLDQFEGLLASAQELNSANIEALTINNNNDAIVENTISSIADSGTNTINANKETEDSAIITGEAVAVADVVNIINRNLIGNTWIFSVINVFGNWVGDLILPGEGLLQTTNSQVATNLEVANENNATITNNVTATASSGENSIENAENSTILTGDVSSSADATTIANTNITQNNWFILLVNNLGSWTGKILGGKDEDSNSYEYNFESNNETDLLTAIYSFLTVHNTNQATVTNNITSNANTGNNSIIGQTKNGVIQTGNASANSNVVNIVNTNIIGNNWIFAIVNIMGSWTGNAVLAYPDLAVSISDGIDQATSGSLLTYKVSYENIGKANCNDAKIEINIPNTLSFQNSNIGNSNQVLSLGKINAGEKKSLTFTVTTNNEGEAVPANVSATISTSTKEMELANNSASDATTISSKQILEQEVTGDIQEDLTGNEIAQYDPDSNLKISRLAMDYPSVQTGNIVNQSIYIENKGDDPLSNITVTEAIKNPKDEIIGKYSWPIQMLDTHEKVLITYQLSINPNAETGTYTYRARGVAINSVGKKVTSNKSSNNLVVFAMHYNNNQNNSDIVPAALIGDDVEIPYDEQVLGTSTQAYNFPPWLILLLLVTVLASIATIWRVLEKRRLRMKLARENSELNNFTWGTLSKIRPKKKI